jgi:hypothetical protein
MYLRGLLCIKFVHMLLLCFNREVQFLFAYPIFQYCCFVSADVLVGLAPIDGEPFATRLHRNGFPEDSGERGGKTGDGSDGARTWTWKSWYTFSPHGRLVRSILLTNVLSFLLTNVKDIDSLCPNF